MVMDSLDALGTVFEAGSFPAFTTDVMMRTQGKSSDDVKTIPILDEAATMHYYCVCKKNNLSKYQKIFKLLNRF